MSYDLRCLYLADHFLTGEPHLDTTDNTDELAQIIQNAVETFIADKKRNYEPLDPMRGVEFPFAENH